MLKGMAKPITKELSLMLFYILANFFNGIAISGTEINLVDFAEQTSSSVQTMSSALMWRAAGHLLGSLLSGYIFSWSCFSVHNWVWLGFILNNLVLLALPQTPEVFVLFLLYLATGFICSLGVAGIMMMIKTLCDDENDSGKWFQLLPVSFQVGVTILPAFQLFASMTVSYTMFGLLGLTVCSANLLILVVGKKHVCSSGRQQETLTFDNIRMESNLKNSEEVLQSATEQEEDGSLHQVGQIEPFTDSSCFYGGTSSAAEEEFCVGAEPQVHQIPTTNGVTDYVEEEGIKRRLLAWHDIMISMVALCITGVIVQTMAYIGLYSSEIYGVHDVQTVILVLSLTVLAGQLACIYLQNGTNLFMAYLYFTSCTAISVASMTGLLVYSLVVTVSYHHQSDNDDDSSLSPLVSSKTTSKVIFWTLLSAFGASQGPLINFMFDIWNKLSLQPTKYGASCVTIGLFSGSGAIPSFVFYLWQRLGSPHVLIIGNSIVLIAALGFALGSLAKDFVFIS